MAPRLFTIASHAKTQKNPIVAASLVANGLISKFFLQQPNSMRAELRKSTFTDAMKWKKVIFVAAGTGLAPFRAYLQEKIFNIKQKSEGKETNVPIISLFFGCKHENGDFIYKDEILAWRNQGIIERLHLAFSRDTATERVIPILFRKYTFSICWRDSRLSSTSWDTATRLPFTFAVLCLWVTLSWRF